MKHRTIAILLLLAPACRGVTVTPLVEKQYPSHQERVCILNSPLEKGLGHVAVAKIKVELNSYGGDRRAKASLAKQARKIGVDAVVAAVFSNLMGAPSGEGIGVRFDEGVEPPSDCEWF